MSAHATDLPPATRSWPSRAASRVRRSRGLHLLFFGLIPVAFVSTFIVFLLSYLSSANPAAVTLGDSATPADIARLNALWGLDKPFFEQYFTWLWDALHGDLGRSYYTGIPVTDSISQRFPVDLSIAVVAIVLAVILGFAAGMLAAIYRDRSTDRGLTGITSVALSIPEFWLGTMFAVIFSVKLGMLPSAGYVPLSASPWQWFRHIILPAGSLSILIAAIIARQLRTSLVATLDENFVIGATVRGLSKSRILFVHVLRNAAGPAVVAIGLAVPALLGGAVVAETVFALPGLGQYAIEGAQGHDVPVVQGVLLLTIVLVIASNVLVDILLGWLRPQTRRQPTS